jgi:hypothetical protein
MAGRKIIKKGVPKARLAKDIIIEIRYLLERLDFFRYHQYNADQIAAIESQLQTLKRELHNHRSELVDMSLTTYPEYEDPKFVEQIFNKKEFQKGRYALPYSKDISYEDTVTTQCDTKTFRLSPNQIFLKNFLSPRTHYNGLLLFHGVGVGKCHKRGTKIMMFNGSIKNVEDIAVGDKLMGDDSSPRQVMSLGRGRDKMYRVRSKSAQDDVSYGVNSEHILALKFIKNGFIGASGKDVTFVKNCALVNREFETSEEAMLFAEALHPSDIIHITVSDYLNLPCSIKKWLMGYRCNKVSFGTYNDDDAFIKGHDHGKRFVPAKIKYANYQTKMSFLLGTCSACDSSSKIFAETQQAYEDLLFLARSMGLRTLVDKKKLLLCIYFIDELEYEIEVVPDSDEDDVYYGFTLDGNHRYLLGDFTVTHNTCAAISIAEQFRNAFDKPVLVLMPSNLIENFRQQIDQCTSKHYRNLIPNHRYLDEPTIEKQVGKIIRENYKFSGFLEFANSIEHIEDVMYRKYGQGALAEAKIANVIKKEYSNRVIIIDEVHNVRSDKEDPTKKTPKRILRVLSNAENVKLIMLTATPMFNGTKEIVWMLNFLLANDKRPLLDTSDCFDEDGKLTGEGYRKLQDASKGYVSYMRGENPFAFPFRLFPIINKDPKCLVPKLVPNVDMRGNPIPEDKRIKDLIDKVVCHEMSERQIAVYNATKPPTSTADDTSDVQDDFEHEEQPRTSITKLIQISNIVYPNETSNPYAKAGFDACFEMVKESKQPIKIKYRKDIFAKHGAFLDPKNGLAKYSTKLKDIVDYILKSDGIVYVYSYYIYSALLPLAIALEHAGFQKSDGTYMVSPASNEKFLINGKQARYSLLTRHQDLYTDINTEVNKIRDPKNANGENIKVILGTTVTAEGINFKNIRQVHIVEPWFHLNRLEQVIGRAVRRCSHITLPVEKRNVTIYQHASILPKKSPSSRKITESIDMRIYQIAEQKQKAIERVEKLLIENAIDCNLNQNVMFFPREKINMKLDIVTSQGVKLKSHPVGDDPNDKHASIQCVESLSKSQEVDERTFHPSFYFDEYDVYVDLIKAMFARLENTVLTYEELEREIKPSDQDVFKYALDYVLVNKTQLRNSNGEEGFLVYHGNKYMFQPLFAPDAYLTIDKRKTFSAQRIPEISIDELALSKKSKISSVSSISAAQIIQQSKELLSKLFPHQTKTYLKRFERASVDYVVDRLTEEQVQDICSTLLKTSKKDLDKDAQLVHASIIDANVLLELPSIKSFILRNVYASAYSDELVSPNELDKPSLKEYQDVRKKAILMWGKDASWVVPTGTAFTQIHSDDYRKRNLDTLTESIDISEVKGYIEVKDTGPRLKIIGTNKNSGGFVCGTGEFTLVDYIEKISEIDADAMDENKKYKKQELCPMYELLLRVKKEKVFLRPFEKQAFDSQRKTQQRKPVSRSKK